MKASEAKLLVSQAPIKGDSNTFLINSILEYFYENIRRVAFSGNSQITFVGFGYMINSNYIPADNISEEIINLIIKDLTDNGYNVKTQKLNYDDKNITEINWE